MSAIISSVLFVYDGNDNNIVRKFILNTFNYEEAIINIIEYTLGLIAAIPLYITIIGFTLELSSNNFFALEAATIIMLFLSLSKWIVKTITERVGIGYKEVWSSESNENDDKIIEILFSTTGEKTNTQKFEQAQIQEKYLDYNEFKNNYVGKTEDFQVYQFSLKENKQGDRYYLVETINYGCDPLNLNENLLEKFEEYNPLIDRTIPLFGTVCGNFPLNEDKLKTEFKAKGLLLILRESFAKLLRQRFEDFKSLIQHIKKSYFIS